MKHPKNENKKKNKRKMSMEKICVVYAVLPGNHLLKIRKVIPYGLRAQEKPANARALWSVDCDWWVHNRCLNIYYESSGAGEKTLAKKHFCQKHMPDVKKIGCDKELQQNVVLPSNSKEFLKKVIQKKIIEIFVVTYGIYWFPSSREI